MFDELFPAVFAGRFEPLKVGVHLDLAERSPATPMEIGAALRVHCRSMAYLRRIRAGADRRDLDGNVCGVVTAEEAALAKADIARIRQLDKEARASRAATSKEPHCAMRLPPATEPEPPKPRRPVISLDGTWKRGAAS